MRPRHLARIIIHASGIEAFNDCPPAPLHEREQPFQPGYEEAPVRTRSQTDSPTYFLRFTIASIQTGTYGGVQPLETGQSR